MTVASETSRNDYVGLGTTATYSYTFRVFAATDLLVTKVDTAGVETGLTYPTDYSVTGVGSFAGGNITLTAGNLPSGYGLTIRFKTGLLQGTDLRNQSGFFPEVIEDAMDRLTKIDQQQQDELGRSIRLPETEAGPMTLPTLASRASRFLAFDTAGAPIAADGSAGTPASPFMATVLDDPTSNAALTTLTATRSEANATAVSLLTKLREHISVNDFGAVGDGVTDDTTALQNAINAAKTNGRAIFAPAGIYNYTSLNLDDILNGLMIYGEGDPYGAAAGKGSYLRCTSAAGDGISIDSSQGIVFRNLWLGYNNVAYTGDLVTLGHSGAATDPAVITFENVRFSGEGAADNANSLLSLKKAIIIHINRCKFSVATYGIRLADTAGGYCNVLNIRDSVFLSITTMPIYAARSCNSINLTGNTFEPLVAGTAGAFNMPTDGSAYIFGLVAHGNWFGDVVTAGGLFWLRVCALGLSIKGNFIGSAGTGAADYALYLGLCQGVSVEGNMFSGGKVVNFFATCRAVWLAGNDMQAVGAVGTAGNVVGGISWGPNYTGTSTPTTQPRSAGARTVAQSIPNNTLTAIAFDSVNFDVGGVHSATTNNSRFTVPVGYVGPWLLSARVAWSGASAVGQRQIRIVKNGSTVIGIVQQPGSGATLGSQITGLDVAATAGDYYECIVYQDSGAALDVQGNNTVDNGTGMYATRLMSGGE